MSCRGLTRKSTVWYEGDGGDQSGGDQSGGGRKEDDMVATRLPRLQVSGVTMQDRWTIWFAREVKRAPQKLVQRISAPVIGIAIAETIALAMLPQARSAHLTHWRVVMGVIGCVVGAGWPMFARWMGRVWASRPQTDRGTAVYRGAVIGYFVGPVPMLGALGATIAFGWAALLLCGAISIYLTLVEVPWYTALLVVRLWPGAHARIANAALHATARRAALELR